MADQSKFGLIAEMVITPIERTDIIVTDQGLSDELEKDLESMGVRVLIA